MVILSHPTGNTFVRALLQGLVQNDLLSRFATTIAIAPGALWPDWLPAEAAREIRRRGYDAPQERIYSRPWRELARTVCGRVGWDWLRRHEKGWASLDQVYQDLDRAVAGKLGFWREQTEAQAVYAYEDGALSTFLRAGELGLRRVYDLPIAYWETARRLLEEEAARYPEWEPTLVGTRNSEEKLGRKRREIEAADVVVCPSRFVLESIPEAIRRSKQCAVVEFGSPAPRPPETRRRRTGTGPMRALFAGSLTQRKGLADLFKAARLLGRKDVEVVVMGSPVAPLDFYKTQWAGFTYEPPRPHAAVLELMESCDVLVLPSIVEGRALVQQEAMTCGLPLLVTMNAGADDLVVPGETGFLTPIRNPEAIAEQLDWMAGHRVELIGMGERARIKAAELTWPDYAARIIDLIRN